MNAVIWGWLAVIGSIISFGSFGVPIKSKKVVEAQVDPIIFQTFKSSWVFLTSFISFTYNEFSYTPWGLLGGIFWVPAGVMAVFAINNIGLGVAQGLWSGLIIIVSFIWGVVVFKEPLRSIPLAIVGVLLLCLGVFGMAISPALFKDQYQEVSTKEKGKEGEEDSKRLLETDEPYFQIFSFRIKRRTILGYCAAIFCGIWGGSIMAPLKIASKRGVKTSGISYVFSFGVGALVVNVAIFIAYCLFRWFYKKQGPPSFHLKVMLLPGSIAGFLWSLGNYLSIYGVLFLGQAIAYPSIQTSLLVSGLWGIVYYRELKGKQIAIWVLSAIIALGGVVVLSQVH